MVSINPASQNGCKCTCRDNSVFQVINDDSGKDCSKATTCVNGDIQTQGQAADGTLYSKKVICQDKKLVYQPQPPTCTLNNNSWASCNKATAGAGQICSGKSHIEYECCNPMTLPNWSKKVSSAQVGSRVGQCKCPNGVEQPAGSIKDTYSSTNCKNGIACYGGEVTDVCRYPGDDRVGENMEVTCNTAPHQTICDKFGKVLVPTSESTPTEWTYTTTLPSANLENWFSEDFIPLDWKTGKGMFGTYETAWARIKTEWNTENIYMRKEFIVKNVPAFFSVRILYNESALVYINGIKVHDSEDKGNGQIGATGKYVSFFSINASEIMNQGKNVLSIQCTQPQNTKENQPPYKYKEMSMNQFVENRDVSFPNSLNFEQQVCDAGLIGHAESHSNCHSYNSDICQCFPEFVQPTNINGSCEVKADDKFDGCQELDPQNKNECRLCKKGWVLNIKTKTCDIGNCNSITCDMCDENGLCFVCAKGYLKQFDKTKQLVQYLVINNFIFFLKNLRKMISFLENLIQEVMEVFIIQRQGKSINMVMILALFLR